VGQGGEACRWYALQVRSQFERKVRDALNQAQIEPYLPTYQTRARWSDRTKTVERILFPGYVFGRFELGRRRTAIALTGVVRILGVGAQPIAIEDAEIVNLQRVIEAGLDPLPAASLAAGQRVRVVEGPLAGVEGAIVRLKGVLRIVVAISLLNRAVSAEVDVDSVEPILATQRAAA
jgi:transcription antitermination factor NusG